MTKQETTLLVTDSGLGGLSVFADLANRVAQGFGFEKVTLIYFNAWPLPDKGYNHFPDMDTKARVFTNALKAMAGFNPDAILIACNTLSVIYPFTAFSKTTAIPVTGIVDHGVQLIYEHLARYPDSRVIIFGTPTTLQDGSHKKALVTQGIDPKRIIRQACVDLAGKIERDPYSPDVSQMIAANAREAAQKSGPCKGKLFAALCCTHFGYCADQFSSALAHHTQAEVAILNPNQAMAQAAAKTLAEQAPVSMVHTNHPPRPRPFPVIDMQILSRVFWEESRIMAYENLLSSVSPRTVDALKNYTWNKKLFQVEP